MIFIIRAKHKKEYDVRLSGSIAILVLFGMIGRLNRKRGLRILSAFLGLLSLSGCVLLFIMPFVWSSGFYPILFAT